MKFLFAGLCILAAATAAWYFILPKQKIHHVIVLIDITSSDIPLPSTRDIINAASLTSEWNSATVSIGLIHEFGISEMKTATLPFVPWYARNALKRKKEAAHFESWIQSVLNEVEGIPKGRTRSVIIPRIVEVLESIPDNQPGVVLAYSDLLEHSDFLNAYQTLPPEPVLYERISSLFDSSRHHVNHSVIIIPPLRNIEEEKTQHTLLHILTEVIAHVGGSVSVLPEEPF